MAARTRRVKTRPDPPDLPPRFDPTPAALEPGAVWDGIEAGPDVDVAGHVPDVTLQECRWVGGDLSGAVLDDAVLTRVTFTDCRLTGLVLAGASLTDVLVTGGHAGLLGLRMARGRHLLVEDAPMRGADLYGFEGADCAFLGCDLGEASFVDARLDGVRLHGSRLDDLHGALALSGARIGPDQVVSLGAALLDALGVTVTPGELS